MWIAIGWLCGAVASFLSVLVFTLQAIRSDDLAAGGSVIAAGAMTIILAQFMWPFVLVLFPAAASLWPAIAKTAPVFERTLAGVLVGTGAMALLIVSGIYGLFWGFGAEINVYVVAVWVYSSLAIPRLIAPPLRPGAFLDRVAA